jgi:hypothetical protein
MVFKQKDSQDMQIRALELRIKQSRDAKERARLDKTLGMLRAGEKGEAQSAYHIDFLLKESPNWAVIHDLGIEVNDRVAQIDHILINRFLEIYVIESKSFRTKIRYSNGGWERLNSDNYWQGIDSPVEQNENHILVLRDLIETHQLAPTRFGLRPNYINIVSVQGSCSIIGKLPPRTKIERVDSLVRKLLKNEPSILWLLKIVSPETLHAFAKTLVTYHQPVELPTNSFALHDAPLGAAPPSTVGAERVARNPTTVGSRSIRDPNVQLAQVLAKKSASTPRGQTTPTNPSACNASPSHTCHACSGPITSAEINFCKTHAARFAGKHLCRSCQKFAPPAKKTSAPPSTVGAERVSARDNNRTCVRSTPHSIYTPLVHPSGVAPISKKQNPAPEHEAGRSSGLSETQNSKLKTQNSAAHSRPPQQKPTVRITIAPRAPEAKTHAQNPPRPVQASPTGAAETKTWEERMNEIKTAHPRAYEEWTTAEENRLRDLFRQRATITAIANALQRQPSAIRARLKKFNLLQTASGRPVVDI